jgi:hypothetical protein
MGIIKEPVHVDLSNKSEPWTAQELIDFRKIMGEIKKKNSKKKELLMKQTSKLKKQKV